MPIVSINRAYNQAKTAIWLPSSTQTHITEFYNKHLPPVIEYFMPRRIEEGAVT